MAAPRQLAVPSTMQTKTLKILAPRRSLTLGSQRPSAMAQPVILRQAQRQTARRLAAAAAPAPAPTAPFLDSFSSATGLAIFELERQATFVLPAAPPVPSANDPNHGHTWLTHPCPHNPFRTDRDEEAWYVPPTLEQRQLAQRLGLPLYGIC